ncbi:MAG: zinc ribbon domain-containing protein [Chloroflexia bacterium]
MTPCRECGRVNPPEAAYCMTCATKLGNNRAQRETRWEDLSGSSSTSSGSSSGSTGGADSRATTDRDDDGDGRFDKVGPLLEDFAFDVVRAGAKLYFASKDPSVVEEARTGHAARGGRDRFERLKDAIAEARTEYRRRAQPGNRNRDSR